ncbi:hypothetical protein [Clostridium magnum]|uniref:Uncharacterized protein n=1 Tax=Clostridium magnum DSM 2767 TaxID=1121326 RepID=A0A162QKY0_9CLOT|nr:hypothetical protein [Clostridium magnum]KZL88654.1 hypothetical protein CLMAG_59430 [Clostridium magnum DSM 2767]KZL88744.1 hypothetical protein CLMAG_60330 [Clostridium magnum DSM 2767]SHJ61521.1 hypothetical protein SAMN02745944_06237 [Clostridium magnum DSM 2767]
MKNCKECPYRECILRTDKEFEICPVDVAKKEFEKTGKIVK